MRWQWRVMFLLIGFTVASGVGLAMAASPADKIDPGPASTDRNWQIGFTPSYSSGNFGTNTTSSFFYAPLSIRRLFKDGDVTLVIPFVMATTDGRSTLIGGNQVQVQRSSNSGSGSSSSGSGSSGSGGGCDEDEPSCLTGQAAGKKLTTAGLGDIILRGRYYVVEEKDYVPLIALTARMKLPTANEKLGLGSGAFDHGYGVEVSKLIGEKWLAFLDGGYNFIGDPDGFELRNQYWYDVGAGYYVTKDLLTSVYFDEYRSLISGAQNIRDVFFAMNYRASSAWRFNGGVALGLSNGAPDYTLSIGTSYRF
jgi:hypothetical protein